MSLQSEPYELANFFSPDYFQARQRFLAASSKRGLKHFSLPIHASSPTSEELTIDVTVAGSLKPSSALVISSGVHGVEGFFGSAVQLACLERLAGSLPQSSDAAVVFLHAINPFGFAWQRRFNEDNVDLNRNFLLPNEQYTGSPPLAGTFRTALRHSRRPAKFGFWTARMAMLALRHGVHSFWETLPVGQYDYPDWLFFGGESRAQSVNHLEQFLPTLLDPSRETVHLDFHTGLGRWAQCQLLVSKSEGESNCDWWKQNFLQRDVTEMRSFTGSYEVRGGFGQWLRALFPQCDYRFATAEFGTYAPIRVIRALADELHWHGTLGTNAPDHPFRSRLTEAFAPRSLAWRQKTLSKALSMIEQAANRLWSHDSRSSVTSQKLTG